jgi:hypothetical protein
VIPDLGDVRGVDAEPVDRQDEVAAERPLLASDVDEHRAAA